MAVTVILLALTAGTALAYLPLPVYEGEISEIFVQKAVQNEDGSRLYQDETSGRGSLICRPLFNLDGILCEGLAGQGDFICKVEPDCSAYDCQGVAGQGSYSCNRIETADGSLSFECQGTGNFGPRRGQTLPASKSFIQKAVQNEDGSRLYQDELSGRGSLICRPPFGKQGILCNGLAGQGDLFCTVVSDRSAYYCLGKTGQGSFSCKRIQDWSPELSFTCEGTGNFGSPRALSSRQGGLSETFIQNAFQNSDGSRLYQDETSGRGSLICRPPFGKYRILCNGLAGQGDFICQVKPDRSAYDCQGTTNQGSFSCQRIESPSGGLSFECQGSGNFGSPKALSSRQSETFIQNAVQNYDGSRLYQDETSGKGSLICRPPFGKYRILCNGLAGQGDFFCQVKPDRSAYDCQGTTNQESFSCQRIESPSGGLSFECQGSGNFGSPRGRALSLPQGNFASPSAKFFNPPNTPSYTPAVVNYRSNSAYRPAPVYRPAPRYQYSHPTPHRQRFGNYVSHTQTY